MTDSEAPRKRTARSVANRRAAPPPLDLDALLYGHAGPALVLDRTGLVLVANLAANQLLSGTAGSVVTQCSFSDFLAPYSQARWQDLLNRLVTDRVEVRGTLDVIRSTHNDQPLAADRVAFAARPIIQGRRLAAIQVVMHAVLPQLSQPAEPTQHAGIAAEKSPLYQVEQRQRRLAEALRQVTLVLNSTLDLATVLELIVEQLQSVVPYDSVSVLLKEDGRYNLVIAHGYPNDMSAVAGVDHNDLPTTQQLLAQRSPLVVADTQL